MTRPWIALVAAALSPLAAGCSDSDACAVICAKSAECQPDGPGEAACNDLCLQQSEDEAYADAVEQQADCYDEGWSCSELAAGACSTPE